MMPDIKNSNQEPKRDKKGVQLSYKNITKIVSMVFIALVIIGSLILILNSYVGTPSPQVAVTTTSMTPTYGGFCYGVMTGQQCTGMLLPLKGDILILKNQLPKLGDVIVYKSENPALASTPIVHRVMLSSIVQ